MAAPQASILRSAAISRFQSFHIQLAAQPSPIARRGPPGSQPQQQTGQPMGMPPALFKAASSNSQDVAYQSQMHDRYMKLFQGLATGIVQAWSQFHLSATLVGVNINGPIATGGRVTCPVLDSLVLASSGEAGSGQWETRIRDRTGRAFWACWKQMLDSVKVPALPWYPALAAFPGPHAPPMPNVPTPLATLTGNPLAMGTPNLKITLSNFLQGSMDYHTQFSEALAVAIDASFQAWKIHTVVCNVMGSGPVPTFAPPYVPIGPVVGGTGNMTPGGFV